MVVQSLCHQVLGQRVSVPGRFLDFCPFVLEPDFDLRLIEAQLLGEALPALLGQVPVPLELSLQPLQLFCGEGCPGSLVLFAW